MQAIILAAGAGKRLASVSNGIPKSMLEIGGRSIIRNQIEACIKIGIESFVIVTGYRKEILEEHILSFIEPAKVEFVENERYLETNTLYSLYLARRYFTAPFLYFNGDVFFEERLLDLIDFKNEKSQLLLKSGECGEEEVKIELHANSTVKRIGKKLNLLECAGEFIGIGYFAEKDLVDFSRYLVEGVSDGQENNFFEHALDKLCQSSEVLVLPTGEIKCLEIDFPEDLEAARKLFTE